MREALFSIWGAEIEGAELLDLFAGSGAVGIEALSRGALGVLFVEQSRHALRLLKQNLASLRLGSPRARVLGQRAEDALVELASAGPAFDLVFADPPYAWSVSPQFLNRLAAVLKLHGSLVLEHSARATVPEIGDNLVQVDTRRYGEAAISFYRRTMGAGEAR